MIKFKIELDTLLREVPICPYCGHRHTDLEDFVFDNAELDEDECNSCGKIFQTERQVTVRYTTRKME